MAKRFIKIKNEYINVDMISHVVIDEENKRMTVHLVGRGGTWPHTSLLNQTEIQGVLEQIETN